VREALLLDLGAIVYELDRQGRAEPDLLHAKELELRAVDDEVRGLAEALDELTANGLVATCTACERLMGSRDRFCPACGAEAGSSDSAEREGPPPPPLREPEFGDTIEVTALNAPEHPAFDEAEQQPVTAAGPPPWERHIERPQARPEPKALVPRAQRKLRAGRRMARQWLEQHRPEGP
jgi:hypothetical protein